MTAAWDAIKQSVISADELWGIPDAYERLWECLWCDHKLLAVACNPKKRHEYRVGPHFRAKQGDPHPCDKKLMDFYSRGQTKAILQEQSVPVPVYDRLVLDDKFEQKADNADALSDAGRTKHHYLRTETTRAPSEEPHSRLARNIFPLCRQYICFPHDRNASPLSVPKCSGRTYREVFQPLWCFKPTINQTVDARIFIGEINFKTKIEEKSRGAVVITLHDGHFSKSSQTSRSEKQSYILHIYTHDWSTESKKALLKNIKDACEESEASFTTRRFNDGLYKRPWIFFLGEQAKSDPFLFHVSDRRFVCCFAEKKDLIWPGCK